MFFLRTLLLFMLTAVAEIGGCYLVLLWWRRSGAGWLLAAAVGCLALFAWLLTLHPAESGRVYASYGGVYVCTAVFWLWAVDGVRPLGTDVVGVLVVLVGMAIIVLGNR